MFPYDIPGYGTHTIGEVAARARSVQKYSSASSIGVYTSVHTWFVRGLNTLCEITSIQSPPLTHQNSSKWCMILKKVNRLQLHILLKKSVSNQKLRAKLKVYEILPCGTILQFTPTEWYDFEEGGKTKLWDDRPPAFPGALQPKNDLVLRCEVSIHCVVQNEVPAVDGTDSQRALVRAVGEMLLDEVLTDFELCTRGTVLKAHKALLSVRSPYFAAMLQPHTKEAKEGRVEISDVTPEVVKQILLYMYTGVAPALHNMPLDLLIAADKYQLLELKCQCEEHIANCLSVDNAIETLVNARLFSCQLLWHRAAYFIKQNLFQVMSTPGWAEAVAAQPDVIQHLCKLMDGGVLQFT